MRKVIRFLHGLARKVPQMDEEIGRRIRAARAYADIKQPKLASQLGVSRDTLYRLEKGGRQMRPLEDESALLARIADLCGLPLGFFTEDYQQLEEIRGGRLVTGTMELVDARDPVSLGLEPVQEAIVVVHEFLERVSAIGGLEAALKLDAERRAAAAASSPPPAGEEQAVEDAIAGGAEQIVQEAEPANPESAPTPAAPAPRATD